MKAALSFVILFTLWSNWASAEDCQVCPSSEYGSKQYCVEEERLDFNSALEYCSNKGQRLATIKDPMENFCLGRLITNLGYGNQPFLTSGRLIHSHHRGYTWVSSSAPVIYFNFAPDQPTNLISPEGERQECLEVSNSAPLYGSLFWSDTFCSIPKPFICEEQFSD